MAETNTSDLSTLKINRQKNDQPGNVKPHRVLVLSVTGAVVLVVLYFVFRGMLAGTREVEVGTATLTSPSQANTILTASGYVVAQIKAAVASKGTGRLVYLGFEEGDIVKKDQIIARLEDGDVIAALEKARADLELARADSFDARQSLERQKTLNTSGLAAKADLDAAEARFLRVRASILSSNAAVQAAQVAFDNTRIRAPFDGTVLRKYADVGEVFAPFASSANSRGAVVTMADMNSLQVEADVSESNIMRVRVGQPCEIVLDAYPEKRYPGTVHKIVPTADRAKATVLTKIVFREKDERVLPEMSAKVLFLSNETDREAGGAPPKLTVPSSSLSSRNGTDVVLLVRDGRITETPVTAGETIGPRVEIKGEIGQGDTVVLRPTTDLTSGSRVKVRAN